MTLNYRSLLFAPGHKPEMLTKALDSAADGVIFDLEDAVPIDERDNAREIVAETLSEQSEAETENAQIFVRVVDSTADIQHIEEAEKQPDGYLLPKVAAGAAVEDASSLLDNDDSTTALIPMIENGAGVINAPEIASPASVGALAFGAEDYTAAVGATRTDSDHEIEYARQRIVAAADAAEVGTLDTVYTDFSDDTGLKEATMRSIELGYDAKPAIHPDQVSVINRAYTPDEEQIEWAETLLNADEVGDERDIGAINVNGEMVDAPLVDRARSIMNRAKLAEKR